MDSYQPGTKREFKVMSIQNQDDDMSSTNKEGEDGAEVKRFKQELHPLQIGSILEQIFSNLDVESIKTARQVNPRWSAEGAKMLITKCYVKVPSEIHEGDFIGKFKSWDEFKAFLSYKSSDFSTIPNIKVDRGDDVKVWEYLGILEQVTSLQINYSINSEKGDEFYKNLLDLLPNLKYLRFDELDEASTFIRVLTSVMSAPEKVCNSLIISSLYLYLANVGRLAIIEKFAACTNIKIDKLTINTNPNLLEEAQMVRIANIVNKLLSTSQNILTKLLLVDCHLILPLLEFPCMTALFDLDLKFESEISRYPQCKFSPTFQFSEKFPKLQDITVSEPMPDDPPVIDQSFRRCFASLLERTGTANSVKNVNYYGNVSDFDIYHIFKTFPNIKDFSTDVGWHSREMLRALWKHGRNLKELSLYLELYSPLEQVYDLDASFTGLPVWIVEEIKQAPNLDLYTVEQLKELRVDLSILNLKELEQLTIDFRGNWKKDLPIRMLAVAGEHAFKFLLKNPEIIINMEDFEDSMDLADVSKLSNVKIV